MITTHDSVEAFVGRLRDAWAPRFRVRRIATRESPRPGGVLHVVGPHPHGNGERSAHMKYHLPIEPGDLTRRALAAMVAPHRLPDYLREARIGV